MSKSRPAITDNSNSSTTTSFYPIKSHLFFYSYNLMQRSLQLRYANAIFSISNRSKCLQPVSDRLMHLCSILKDPKNKLQSVILDPMQNHQMKLDSLQKAMITFKSDTSAMADSIVKNSLACIADFRRLEMVPSICEAFAEMKKKHEGTINIHVKSAKVFLIISNLIKRSSQKTRSRQ